MLKSTFKIFVGILITASLSFADGGDFVDIKMGVGQWNTDAPVGVFGDSSTNTIDLTSQFAIEPGTAQYVWAEFQHFLPIIPHFRMEYEQMPFQGTPTIAIPTPLGTYTFTGTAEMNLENLDLILFYDMGLFDDMVDFNYGLGAKIILGDITGTVAGQTEVIPLAGAALYAYINARVEILLGLNLELEYKWFPDGISPDLVFSEYIAKVDYTFDFIPLLEFGVEGGVRAMDLLINSTANSLYTEQAFSGVFFGAFAKFGI